MFKDKSIIVIKPSEFDIYKDFKRNLDFLEIKNEVIVPENFRYKKFKDRLFNFFHKKIHKNRNYKNYLIKKYFSEELTEKLSHYQTNSVDFILIIRPDKIDIPTLKRIKNIGKKMVGYQWDGLHRFPEVFETIEYFDDFFVFDKDDFERYKSQYANLKRCDNFYFDYPSAEIKMKNDRKNIYYLGSYIKNRFGNIVYFIDILSQYEIDLNIILWGKNDSNIRNKNIVFTRDRISMYDNLKSVQKSDIILDFKVKEHNGLSFRFFEAIKYEKKIITDNPSVMNYDFYNSKNIFVIGKDNLLHLEVFINSEYQKLPTTIYEKYSFSSWLKRILS